MLSKKLFTMKKIVLALFLVGSLAFSDKLQAQRIGFYFYPDLNVYYNTRTHQYAYNDNGNWVYHRSLPSNMRVKGHSHVTVYRNDAEIWRDNDAHRDKYK